MAGDRTLTLSLSAQGSMSRLSPVPGAQYRRESVVTVNLSHNQPVYVPDICGPSWWAVLHGVAQAIRDCGCSSCGEWAVKAMHAIHDTVNWKLGKPVRYPGHLKEVASAMAKAAASVEKPSVLRQGRGPRGCNGIIPKEVTSHDHTVYAATSSDSGRGHWNGCQALQPEGPNGRYACRRGQESLGAHQQDQEGRREGASLPRKLILRQLIAEAVVLDTSVLSILTIPGHPLRPFYAASLAGRPVFTTLIAVAENIRSFRRLSPFFWTRFWDALFSVPRVELIEDVAFFWAELRELVPRRQTSDNDLWIAAFAMAYDMPLVTDDKDQVALNGLTVEGRTLRILSRHLSNLAQRSTMPPCHGAQVEKLERASGMLRSVTSTRAALRRVTRTGAGAVPTPMPSAPHP